jgi:outer membrane protein assembly factor BamB
VERNVPEVPSTLAYRGRVYMVTSGGVVTCVKEDGTELYRSRLGATGLYWASPVAANGVVYFVSGDGVVTAIEAADTLKVLARNDLGETVFATPAISGKSIYVRTAKHLYRFGE